MSNSIISKIGTIIVILSFVVGTLHASLCAQTTAKTDTQQQALAQNQNPSQYQNTSHYQNPFQHQNPSHPQKPSQLQNPSQQQNPAHQQNPSQHQNPSHQQNPSLHQNLAQPTNLSHHQKPSKHQSPAQQQNLAQSPQLKISESGRYIVKQDNTPFFWLGDTCWELFHRTTRKEADEFLENRFQKGFTVVQAVIISGLNTSDTVDGLTVPNDYGDLPLENRDPDRPNENYFEHIDYVVNRADSLGMYIALLPTWGAHVVREKSIFTPKNAFGYGQFLGKRYKGKPVIWILGGDNIPKNEKHFEVFRSMARGLEAGHDGTQIMTYHPWGENSSANFFHEDDWLDFNMFQSGHARLNGRVYEMVRKEYGREPVKPVLDGEPNYEDHSIGWEPRNGWFDDFDTRRAGYWALLSGACGHTYGNGSIWQLWEEGIARLDVSRTPWRQAMDYPGAFQAGYMRALFESRPWQELRPAQDIIIEGTDAAGKTIVASVARDGSFLMAYTPYGNHFKISLERLQGKEFNAWWFNPRDKTSIAIGKIGKKQQMEFDPPADEARGNDWVLVVDDTDKNFPPPGKYVMFPN